MRTFPGQLKRGYSSGVFREEFSIVRQRELEGQLLSGVAVPLSANFGRVTASQSLSLYAFVAFASCFSRAVPAQGAVAPLQLDQFIGATGCKSSSCHGGAGEKRSQYLTWVKQDFHARSYAVLTTARSARMAETLKLSKLAQESEHCTVCHSPFQSVASARLTKSAAVDEGVSCENCHGAAGQWLRGHTRKDWTYATRVGAGMHDLRNFYVRANTCVACHQNLEPDLLRAGHPELTFELDGQSVAEPKHWRDDDPSSGPRAWLVGQAVALREMSWQLANEDAPAAESVARWNALAWLLAKTTSNQAQLQVIDAPGESTSRANFAVTQEQSDLLARQASAIPWDDRRAVIMLRAAMATESDFATSSQTSTDLLCARACRLVLALDRLSRAATPKIDSSPMSPALSALFEDIRARPDFRAAKFAADLATFRTTIERTP